jgi:hypothetical protein
MTRSELKAMTMEERRRYWTEQSKRLEESGQGLQQYCEQNELSYHTFRNWRIRLNREHRKASSFARVMVRTEREKEHAVREQSGLAQLSLPSPRWVAEFIRALSMDGGLQ